MALFPRPDDPDDDLPEPPQVRRLRLLVTALTAVMIIGMVTVSATLVMRIGGLRGEQAPAVPAADHLTLPEGAQIQAIGQGRAGILIVTREGGQEMLRVFDPDTGAERSSTAIRRD